MFRSVCLIILSCFFLWILPLGAFIDSTKEAKVCAGKRAVCLCLSKIIKPHNTALTKTLITASAASMHKTSGGFGADFILPQRFTLRILPVAYRLSGISPIYPLPVMASAEPVPKA